MKKLLLAFVTGVAMLAATNSAHALSIMADFPLQYTYNDANLDADSVSGIKLGFKLPILVGIAVESYTVTIPGDATASLPEMENSFQFLDFYYELPIPILAIGAGVGLGSVSLTDTTGVSSYNNGFATQYWLSLGYEFLPLTDVHIGYHVTKGAVENASTKAKTAMDGNMLSLGVRFGF